MVKYATDLTSDRSLLNTDYCYIPVFKLNEQMYT